MNAITRGLLISAMKTNYPDLFGVTHERIRGIKVLDLCVVWGQSCNDAGGSRCRGDQGRAVTGEQMRHIGPTVNKVTAAFFSCNRGKRSIAVDLKSENGKILFDLVKGADVLLQNRPGAMDRMGLGASDARAQQSSFTSRLMGLVKRAPMPTSACTTRSSKHSPALPTFRPTAPQGGHRCSA